VHVWVGAWVDVLVTAQYNFAEQLGLQSCLNGLIATFFVNGETGGKAATSSLFLIPAGENFTH